MQSPHTFTGPRRFKGEQRAQEYQEGFHVLKGAASVAMQPYRPVSPPGSRGRRWCSCAWQGWGHPVVLRLSSDSTCRTVSAGHPGETRDKGIISPTKVKRAAFLQNGAVTVHRYKTQWTGERAEHAVLDARLPLVLCCFLTLVGRGHSSNSRVITAGPSGSSNGITRIRDWTTSSQPSSEEEEEKKFLV